MIGSSKLFHTADAILETGCAIPCVEKNCIEKGML